MDFPQILVLLLIAAAYLLVIPSQWRSWALMVVSVVAIYWLQPTISVRWLDYSLPTATLLLTIVCWWISKPSETRRPAPQDTLAGAIIVGIVLLLALARYVQLPQALELTSRPPEIFGIIIAMVLALGIAVSVRQFTGSRSIAIGLVVVMGLLIVMQTPPLAGALSGVFRGQSGQDVSLASSIDLNWLGFSYVAFRLTHTLRDRQTGILPDLSLRDYVTYVVFAPAYASGPIDRVERFAEDLSSLPTMKALNSQRITLAFSRIGVGMFKKFVIADSLAVFSLDAVNATQSVNAGATWVMLYTYGFRLFFDFSGYSDIAIGIGMLFGIQLRENFDRPYLKNNITAFWQAWHMSLTNWVRFYIFSPLSRNLLRREPKPSNEVIMFICHLSTMMIIGLWHSVTLTFLLWGLWHGLGLWLHKLWSDRTRKWYMGLKNTPRRKQAWTFAGWFLTFHFVMLGWVWFSMPSVDMALSVFARLLGVGR